MNAKILEIFRSIQGEGKYAGLPQVFVRFFECNMHCVWCDTPHSIGDTTRKFKEYTIEQLEGAIGELWQECHSVSLTGGEPLLQADAIKQLLPWFKKNKMPVYLDTNGTLPDELRKIIVGVDTIAMDIKLPSSTKERAYWKEHEAFLKVANKTEVFIKAVISSDTQEEDVAKAMKIAAKVNPKILFILQPNYFQMKEGAVEKCLEFQKYSHKILKDVRIVPQLHKFMKIR